jgi:type III restriction enzyme
VTPTTAKLLSHWRSYEFEGLRPFFCQVETAETMIWLTEVARGRRQYAHIWKHLEAANEQANPELFRLAMKMATGAGKTTVMAVTPRVSAICVHPPGGVFNGSSTIARASWRT